VRSLAARRCVEERRGNAATRRTGRGQQKERTLGEPLRLRDARGLVRSKRQGQVATFRRHGRDLPPEPLGIDDRTRHYGDMARMTVATEVEQFDQATDRAPDAFLIAVGGRVCERCSGARG
jgi:hypothetical protein